MPILVVGAPPGEEPQEEDPLSWQWFWDSELDLLPQYVGSVPSHEQLPGARSAPSGGVQLPLCVVHKCMHVLQKVHPAVQGFRQVHPHYCLPRGASFQAEVRMQ